MDDDATEAEAIDAAKRGESDAYDILVSRHLRRVVAIAWGLVRNRADAEDLAQNAFLRAYETIGRFNSGQPFGPWINRIVTNLALDLIKHRGRVRNEEVSESEPSARRDSTDLRASSAELRNRIDTAIESLPEMQRIVARLFLVEQFAHGEIAAMMNSSEGTVRSHLSLARKKLRAQLSDLYETTDD